MCPPFLFLGLKKPNPCHDSLQVTFLDKEDKAQAQVSPPAIAEANDIESSEATMSFPLPWLEC